MPLNKIRSIKEEETPNDQTKKLQSEIENNFKCKQKLIPGPSQDIVNGRGSGFANDEKEDVEAIRQALTQQPELDVRKLSSRQKNLLSKRDYDTFFYEQLECDGDDFEKQKNIMEARQVTETTPELLELGLKPGQLEEEYQMSLEQLEAELNHRKKYAKYAGVQAILPKVKINPQQRRRNITDVDKEKLKNIVTRDEHELLYTANNAGNSRNISNLRELEEKDRLTVQIRDEILRDRKQALDDMETILEKNQ